MQTHGNKWHITKWWMGQGRNQKRNSKIPETKWKFKHKQYFWCTLKAVPKERFIYLTSYIKFFRKRTNKYIWKIQISLTAINLKRGQRGEYGRIWRKEMEGRDDIIILI